MSEQKGYTSELVHALPEGGVEALNELLAHTWEQLRRLAGKMLLGFPAVARREETDDVVQVAAMQLTEVLRSSPLVSARHYYNLSAQVMSRALLDLARKHKGPWGMAKNHHTDRDGRAADDPGGPLHALQDDRDDPSSLEEWARLHEEVEKLPEAEREVFKLIFYEGKSQEEAARILDISVRTVKRRYRLAKILLSRAMRK